MLMQNLGGQRKSIMVFSELAYLNSALYIYKRCEESIHSHFHDILQCVGRCVDRESADVLVDCDSVVF